LRKRDRELASHLLRLMPELRGGRPLSYRRRISLVWPGIRPAARSSALAVFLVAAASAYCSHWGWDFEGWPSGVPSAYLVATVFAIRWRGLGAGWLAALLSMAVMLCAPLDFDFLEDIQSERFVWMAVALLLPFIAVRGRPAAPTLYRPAAGEMNWSSTHSTSDSEASSSSSTTVWPSAARLASHS
jgi:hypothetical protein